MPSFCCVNTKNIKMKSKKPILLVEDDSVDAMTVKRALNDLQVTNQLDVVGNGEEALKYLQNRPVELPCIILLDLNMPKMNGIEFLKIVKEQELSIMFGAEGVNSRAKLLNLIKADRLVLLSVHSEKLPPTLHAVIAESGQGARLAARGPRSVHRYVR